MAQILELAHLVQQHGVAEVQVGRGRIEAGLDAQRTASLQPRLELIKLEYFLGTAADNFEYIIQFSRHKGFPEGLKTSA